jgi:hypothetical protein
MVEEKDLDRANARIAQLENTVRKLEALPEDQGRKERQEMRVPYAAQIYTKLFLGTVRSKMGRMANLSPETRAVLLVECMGELSDFIWTAAEQVIDHMDENAKVMKPSMVEVRELVKRNIDELAQIMDRRRAEAPAPAPPPPQR